MDILRIEHLSKIYGKGDTEVRALDDVSFTVPKGQFVAIIGPSGSGKSTLLHILGGVDTPTDGHVYVDGTDITTLDETALAIFRRRQIGLIYQFYNLIPILTVEENMTLPLLLDDKRWTGRTLIPWCRCWACSTDWGTCPQSCPAVSSSGCLSAVR